MKTRHREVILSKCPECDNKVVVWNIEDTYFSPREYTEMTFKQIKDKASELVELL